MLDFGTPLAPSYAQNDGPNPPSGAEHHKENRVDCLELLASRAAFGTPPGTNLVALGQILKISDGLLLMHFGYFSYPHFRMVPAFDTRMFAWCPPLVGLSFYLSLCLCLYPKIYTYKLFIHIYKFLIYAYSTPTAYI